MFDTSVVVIIQENVKFAKVLRFETISTAEHQDSRICETTYIKI